MIEIPSQRIKEYEDTLRTYQKNGSAYVTSYVLAKIDELADTENCSEIKALIRAYERIKNKLI